MKQKKSGFAEHNRRRKDGILHYDKHAAYIKGLNTINRMRIKVGLEPLKKEKRVCLRCDRKFQSSSSNNRICQICRRMGGEEES